MNVNSSRNYPRFVLNCVSPKRAILIQAYYPRLVLGIAQGRHVRPGVASEFDPQRLVRLFRPLLDLIPHGGIGGAPSSLAVAPPKPRRETSPLTSIIIIGLLLCLGIGGISTATTTSK